MFTTGLPQLGLVFFTAASMAIAIPSGVQIFCWLASLWRGRPRLEVPLLFVLGFIAIFVLGGLTGVMLASVPVDLQVHDTYFVVAHFHYVLIGGLIFSIFGGLHFWFPKLTGRFMNDSVGKIQFWLFFIGFNLTFMPQHWIGLLGMPRRIFTYSADLGVTGLNQLSTAGVFVQIVAVLLLFGNVLWSWRRGARAGTNPWGAATLEWATTSPPAEHNFNRIPTVHTREPLWLEAAAVEGAAQGPVEPHIHMPKSSYWPIVAGFFVVTTFALFMTHVWWAPLVGLAATFVAVINWAYEPT
jgi:cytochrome c oxidase subunit 1